jgi:hypothetical protein
MNLRGFCHDDKHEAGGPLMPIRDIDLRDFNPLRPSVTPENWYSARTDVIWIEAPNREVARAAAHEVDHFVVHISTPYGVFIQQLADLQRQAVIQYCVEVNKPAAGGIFYPVSYLDREWPNPPALDKLSVTAKRLQRDALDVLMPGWWERLLLEQVLEGADSPAILTATEAEAIEAFHNVDGDLLGFYSDNDLFESAPAVSRKAEAVAPFVDSIPARFRVPEILRVVSGKACPTNARRGGRSAPVGAINMFEGHALVTQKGYDTLTMREILFRDPTLQYATALLAVTNSYGVKNLKSAADVQRVFSTIAALTDLALFTPIGPLYTRLRPKGATWHDVHPGFRFFHAVEKAAKLNLWLERLDQVEYRDYQDRICLALDWPNPDQFVEIGCLLREDRFPRHRKACLTRREFPCLNFEDTSGNAALAAAMKQLFAFQPPMVFVRALGHTSLRPNGALSLDQVITYFLETFTWDVMAEKQMNPRNCLPNMLDYKAALGIANAEELWQMVDQALPFLHQKQLKALHNNN